MRKLAEHDKSRVIDLLSERLAFERSSVRLYDAVIEKLEASNDERALAIVDELRVQRDQEQEHQEWLAEEIRALGGDPRVTTELAELVLRETKGIEDVILDGDDQLPHLLHGLLAAELTDNAGWDLLLALADEAGDREAKRQFRKRLREEQEHLSFVHLAMTRLAFRTVLGEDVEMPTTV